MTEDGIIEENGYFIIEYNAKVKKDILDKEPWNKKYNIKQNIIEIETED